ncbi:hypothetical protein FNF31_01542 [Cafeteria roenbergensis]|uniref:Uncharacterized protein n=1 Tax=Cafeteria roenbergensis TaxID=33653 RepID=A0A5A8DM66_CAFRO|nr:hypothetical protein FNF31_01542 [Cafeteria roenbergensis]
MLDAQGVVSAARLVLESEECDPERVSFEPQASAIWAWLTPAWCRWVWLAPLIVYLVTDIAVFSVFIPSTAAHVIAVPGVAPVTLAVLTAVMTPLAATSLRNTTCLQLALLVARHLALAGMLVAAVGAFPTSPAMLAPGALDVRCAEAQRHQPAPGPLPPGEGRLPPHSDTTVNCTVLDTWSLAGLPLIVSSSTYALINQQYVPAIFAPVALQQRAAVGDAASRSVYLVAAYLLALAWTGVLAFDGRAPASALAAVSLPAGAAGKPGPGPIDPLYSLTFSFVEPGWLASALMLAPAVALLSTYPLVAITLRDAYMAGWGLLRGVSGAGEPRLRPACWQGEDRTGSVAVASSESAADSLEDRAARLAELDAVTAEAAIRWAADTVDPAPWLVLAMGVAVLAMTTAVML